MNIFEKAAKVRLRFDTQKGQLVVEDLFDLSLQSLDRLAQAVNRNLKAEAEESFLPDTNKARKAQTYNDLRLEVLKHVIDVKLKEQDAAKQREDRKAKLESLKALAANKQSEAFAAQSLEEIMAQINALESE